MRHLNPEFADFVGAFKANVEDVAKTAPYMHTGEFDTLDEVLNFYNTMPGEMRMGHRELFLKPLHLSIKELLDLKRFLGRSAVRISHSNSSKFWNLNEKISSFSSFNGRPDRRWLGTLRLGIWQVDRWYQMSAQKAQFDRRSHVSRSP